MKKRFNVYSMGVLVLKDHMLDNFKNSIKRNKAFTKKINKLTYNEIAVFSDPDTGRQWEFERII